MKFVHLYPHSHSAVKASEAGALAGNLFFLDIHALVVFQMASQVLITEKRMHETLAIVWCDHCT